MPAKRTYNRKKCPHNRQRSYCVDCGGCAICPHKRQRSKCVDCNGSQICKHKRQRRQCVECGGNGICQHKRRRYTCKECPGKGICRHNKRRSSCKECKLKKRMKGGTPTTSTTSGKCQNGRPQLSVPRSQELDNEPICKRPRRHEPNTMTDFDYDEHWKVTPEEISCGSKQFEAPILFSFPFLFSV
eukprot:GSMAST32.ASY1.ANO1.1468.1 assembled CDS